VREQLTMLRATTAKHIYDNGDRTMSFDKLAKQLSISRSRAAQLVTQARQHREDQEEEQDG
jgi:biotin operon repressor